MVEAFVTAALHAVVASFVLGAVLGGITLGLVRTLALSAAVRHLLWTIALVATATIPLAAFTVSVSRAVHVPVAVHAPRTAPRIVSVTGPDAARVEEHGAPGSGTRGLAPQRWTLTLAHPSRTVAIAIVVIWIGGAAIGYAGLMLSLLRVRGLKRRSSPLEGALADALPWLTENAKHEREIYLRLSYEIETPVAIGFRRPVILIPIELAAAGGLGDIEPLVMHEHAHLARRDDWTNLLQRTIERLFWFNPLVWIVGRRIALEREIASDEAVIARTGRPKEYATSLWRLAREMRMPEHAVVAPGALLTRKQISIRIETLLSGRTAIPALGPLAALAIVGAAVFSIIAAASSAPAVQLPPPALVALTTPAPDEPAPATPRPSASDEARSAASKRVFDEAFDTQWREALEPDRHAGPATPATPAVPATSPSIARAAAANHPAPVPRPSAHVRVSVDVDDADGVRVDVDGIKRSIADIVGESLARVPSAVASAYPRAVAQARLNREAADTTDLATVAQILRQCMGCDMSDRNLRGIDLRGSTLVGTNLADSDLRGSRLDGVTFNGVNLSGARLDGASLVNARFTGVNIEDVSLHGAKVTGLRVIGSSFADMDLRGLDLRSMLDGCVGCNLQEANLEGSDLHGITLTGANLSEANVRGVNFSGSRLNGTNFADANASRATFANASLLGCNFSGATLEGTQFHEARLDGANLSPN